LAALWYSGDIDRDFTPASHFQHERNPYPLVAHGRMFLIAHQMLHAVDIYTGRYLWRAEMPVTDWVAARSQDSRVYGRPVDRNYLATQDAVYVILEREIHVYSADDGSHRRVIGIPSDVQSEVADPRWTEVREQDGLLHAVVGNRLIVLDRHTGELCWQRPSTLGATTFALGDGRVFGLDFVATGPRGSRNQNPQQGTLFVLNARTGETIWSRSVQYDPVPEHEVDNPRPWLLPIDPQLAYNARHRLIVLVARRNSIRVHRAEDGSPVWHRAGEKRNLPRIYPPVVTDDHLVIFQYNGFFAYVLDLVTGDASGQQGIPAPRTCARVLGSNDLLAYRDAATELYDLREQRMIGLNSVRSGCTTSFIPAGGILTAPMLGHGCVCNYPMFASQALFYWPEIETHRPATVTGSWVNQAESVAGETETRTTHGNHESPLAELPIDVSKLRTINSTVERVGDALRVTVQDEGVGYAVQRFEPAQQTAVFQFAVRRTPDTARNGNVSFIFGDGDTPQRWVECRVFYGGRSSLMIAGAMAEPAEAKAVFKRRDQLLVTVSVDCQARTVTLNAGGQEVTSKLTAALEKITHIGYGGANSDNLLSATRGR
jgi:outer membrane protein assembly factor BamB